MCVSVSYVLVCLLPRVLEPASLSLFSARVKIIAHPFASVGFEIERNLVRLAKNARKMLTIQARIFETHISFL